MMGEEDTAYVGSHVLGRGNEKGEMSTKWTETRFTLPDAWQEATSSKYEAIMSLVGVSVLEDNIREGEIGRQPRLRHADWKDCEDCEDWAFAGPGLLEERLAGFGTILGGMPRQGPNREVGGGW